MLVSEVLNRSVNFLKKKGFEFPRQDSELIISKALGWERIELYIRFEYPLGEVELVRCREYLRRRSEGEPVAYITGQVGFYQDDFFVGPGVLIPRSDSETILDELERLIQQSNPNNAAGEIFCDPLIVDFGCGSGCLGLSALRVLEKSRLIGVDISSSAMDYSQRNAEALNLSDRSEFVLSSVEDFYCESSAPQIIIANPPYIQEGDPEVESSVKNFEPVEALYSAEKGLFHFKSWVQKAIELLQPGGLILFEMGYKQGFSCLDLIEKTNHFKDIEIVKDLGGRDRVLRAFKKNI